ncbi:MAG: VTT domain-containing protein, partial [Pseudomonadales bacterium]
MKALLLPVLVVVLLLLAWFLPVVEYLQTALNWIQANPSISWAVYIVLYIIATVLMLPGSILTLGAGFLFGLGYGYLVVSVASVTGATLAFLVGRFLARDWVESKLAGMPRFSALDKAVSERGALIVLLTRLSPVFPFNLLNYALGLTAV